MSRWEDAERLELMGDPFSVVRVHADHGDAPHRRCRVSAMWTIMKTSGRIMTMEPARGEVKILRLTGKFLG